MAAELPDFNPLPLEIVAQIFDLIPFCEKKNARLVCHLWGIAIDTQRSVVFRPKITNNASMKYFLNSYRSMDSVIMENVNIRMTKKMFANPEFPRIKNAELGWKNSEGNIERFLTAGCEHSESLTLAKFSLERISRGAILKILSEIDWKNLTRFKVVVTTSEEYKNTGARKHLRNLTTVLKYARIPALKQFDFNFDFCYGFEQKHQLQYRKLFLGLYAFLVGHSKVLKVLTGRIYITNQSPLDIQEIPMELEQSLASNMKLQQCSLSVCGIRRIETIINPALFGGELKLLDIQLPFSSYNSSWNLLREAFTLNFADTFLPIFERNGKTLTHVSLNMNVYPLALLDKCTALESLKLKGVLNTVEMEDLAGLSHIRLKSFSAEFMFGTQIPFSYNPGLFRLLCQSVETLEHLCIYKIPGIVMEMHARHTLRFWLSDCVALKSLSIAHMSQEDIEDNMHVEFPHLTELRTFLTPGNRRTASRWITKSMRNLEIITMTGPYTDTKLLGTLFTLPKLKRIIFQDKGWRPPPPNDIEEIKGFCAIPGVTFTTVNDGRQIGHYGKVHVITLNRSNLHNPNNN